MAAPKTRPTDQDVTAFLDAVEAPVAATRRTFSARLWSG